MTIPAPRNIPQSEWPIRTAWDKLPDYLFCDCKRCRQLSDEWAGDFTVEAVIPQDDFAHVERHRPKRASRS